MYLVSSVNGENIVFRASHLMPDTFSDFMDNILETEQNYSITKLFEIGSQIWKNKNNGYFIDTDYKIFFRNKEITTLVFKDQIWTAEISKKNDLVNISYGSKYKPSSKSIQFNDYEQCQCFVEKQIIIYQKKGYTYVK